MRISPRLLFPLLMAVPFLQGVYYHPRLPQMVASHFGADGSPDDWTEKTSFVVVSLVLSEVVIGFLAMLVLVGRLLVPIDVPGNARPANPEEAERRRQYGELARQSYLSFATWFGLATSVFLLAILQMAYAANMQTPTGRVQVFPVLVPYLVILGVLIYRLARAESRMNRLCPRALPPGVWFPAKRIGYGWGPPCCWQGWVFMGGWMAMLLGGIAVAIRLAQEMAFAFILPYALVMVVILVVVCWKKGERPGWRGVGCASGERAE